MNNLGTFVALAEGGRLFGLDLQLLLDAAITAVNVFILFILLFPPVPDREKMPSDTLFHIFHPTAVQKD